MYSLWNPLGNDNLKRTYNNYFDSLYGLQSHGGSVHITQSFRKSGSCSGSQINLGTIESFCSTTFDSADCIGFVLSNSSGINRTGRLRAWNECNGTVADTGNVTIPQLGSATLQVQLPAGNSRVSSPTKIRVEASDSPSGWAAECWLKVSGIVYIIADSPSWSSELGDCCPGSVRCPDGLCRTCTLEGSDCSGISCCSGLFRCTNDNTCKTHTPDGIARTTCNNAPCIDGTVECSDGFCRSCTPINNSTTCTGVNCCADAFGVIHPKCANGRCKGCTTSGNVVDTSCSACCTGLQKCSDNVCRSTGLCTPEGVSCPDTGCCPGTQICANDSIERCQKCKTSGQQVVNPWECCCAGLTKCPDGVCRSGCIPDGTARSTCPSLLCCNFECGDGLCRTCTPADNPRSFCQRNGTLGPCCDAECDVTVSGNKSCRKVIYENERWDKCDKDIPCANKIDLPGYAGPNLYKCADGYCRRKPPDGVCCIATNGVCGQNCSTDECGECAWCERFGMNGCWSCTTEGYQCSPPKECCNSLQRCFDGYCRKCTVDFKTCSGPCCCSWESSRIVNKTGVGF